MTSKDTVCNNMMVVGLQSFYSTAWHASEVAHVRRNGVWGVWQRPYLTLEFKYQACI